MTTDPKQPDDDLGFVLDDTLAAEIIFIPLIPEDDAEDPEPEISE